MNMKNLAVYIQDPTIDRRRPFTQKLTARFRVHGTGFSGIRFRESEMDNRSVFTTDPRTVLFSLLLRGGIRGFEVPLGTF